MVARRWLLLIEGSPVLVGVGWLVAWTNESYVWFFAVWSAVLLGWMSRYALTWAISSGRVEDRHSTVAAYLSRPGRRRMDGALGGVALLVMAIVAWGLFAGPFTDAQAVLAGVGLWVFVGLVQVWALFEFLAASPPDDRSALSWSLSIEQGRAQRSAAQPKRPEM